MKRAFANKVDYLNSGKSDIGKDFCAFKGFYFSLISDEVVRTGCFDLLCSICITVQLSRAIIS